jgi:Ca2+-binding EF-hand superfamily protein
MRRQNYHLHASFLAEKRERLWMKNRGKYHLLDFSDEELNKLRECFGNLDDDGSGSIGIDELEIPLIGLGFANSREEVEDIVKEVDEDGSG